MIDTSGAECSIALIENGQLLAEQHERIGRGHAECLMPWIADLPGGGRADQIVVGCGPGSFTGVRVGIAAARGLALGWDVPVFGVSSLALVAADAAQDEPLLVATEGGHGELFLQGFGHGPLHETGPVQALTPADAALKYQEDCVAGSGAARFIAARGHGHAVEAAARAAALVRLPQAAYRAAPTPVYGRAPDAKPQAA